MSQMPDQITPFVANGEDAGAGAEISARVSAVFTAAEKAAQHVLTMAREEADDIRRRAHTDAEATRTHLRAEAEQEAARLVEQARVDAETIKAESRESAGRIDAEADARKLRLREEVRLLGERIDWAHDGLREVAARLDGLFPEERLDIAAQADDDVDADHSHRQ
jgi:hypothetical protein